MENNIEELNNKLNDNLSKQLVLTNKLEYLPKGHVNTLYRNGKGYYYLTYREGKKITNDYLGPAGKVDLGDTFVRLKQRESIVKEIKELKRQEKELNKQIKKLK